MARVIYVLYSRIEETKCKIYRYCIQEMEETNCKICRYYIQE